MNRYLCAIWEQWKRERRERKPEFVDAPRVSIIPFNQAVICLSCRAVSDWTGVQCPACAETGTLLSVARILQPTPELGRVCYVYSAGNA